MKRGKKRMAMPKKTSKKLFARTGKGAHPKNTKLTGLSRGGIRL